MPTCPASARKRALRSALIYAVLAMLWVMVSDRLLMGLTGSLESMVLAQSVKALLFVVTTAVLLYFLMKRFFLRHLEQAAEREAQLATNSRRYQLLFDASPAPMWVYDTDTLQFLAVNEAALQLYGYSQAEWMQLSVMDLRPEEDRARFLALVRSLPSGLTASGVWTHICHDGKRLRVDISSHGLTFDGRKARLVQGLDVTEQERVATALRESEQRWAMIIEANNDGVWEWNVLSGASKHSERLLAMLGYTPQEVADDINEWSSRIHPEDRERVWDDVHRHLRGETPLYQNEHRLRSKSGNYLWFLSRGKATDFDEQGLPIRMLGTLTDINAHKVVEASLRLAAGVFEQSHEGQFVLDDSLRIISINRAFSAITGYSGSEARGNTLDMLGDGNAQWLAVLEEALIGLAENGHWEGEGEARRENGEIYPLWLSLSNIRNNRDEVTHFCGLIADISERRAADERIQFLSNYDALTQLPNRLLFHDRLQQLLAQAERRQQQLAVCLLNVDHFRTINDSLGHAMGDRLLQSLTLRLQTALRDEDTLSRLSGDEFIVALPDINDGSDAARIAEKILAVARAPMEFDGQEINCTASVGISLYPDDGLDADSIIRNADAALSHAKQSGRNVFRFYAPEMNAHTSELLALESGMRRGLERREFELHFQPQVAAESGELLGVEALVRWRHPERGLIPPNMFIPLAEERGFIIELGDWILKEACRQSMSWRAMGLGRIPVAVNLSGVQFRDWQLPGKIAAALKETGLPPEDLELEITESVLMDVDSASQMLGELRRMGVRLSIDDFGTGFSSLSYLRRFAIHKLKIDQSFIRDLQAVTDTDAIVRTIIQLARNLHLTVIAEGVETELQWNILRGLGCDEIQGYYFSRPLPVPNLIEWINAQALKSAGAPPAA